MPTEIPTLHSTVPATVNAATEQLRAIEKVQGLIERLDELNPEEAITLFGTIRSLGCMDHDIALEHRARAVHLAVYQALSADYDAEQLKKMRIQTAKDLGAEDVAALLEHDPDRYQDFTGRFFGSAYQRLK